MSDDGDKRLVTATRQPSSQREDDASSDRALYRGMKRIRLLEEEVLRLHSRGLLFGTTHTCLGQEAIAVGTLLHLAPQDRVFSNHRGHGHFLAQGGSARELIAELMGRATGVSGGRGGSQHLHQGRFVSSGVQGGLLPTALGTAMAAKQAGNGGVVVVFFGDGTLGQGVVYETMNMAALWRAPILFVLENNRIAQTTPIEDAVAGDMCLRASAFGIRAEELDVEDVRDVVSVAEGAFQYIRSQQAPFFLALNTFRLGPHSKGDDDRTPEDLKSWQERDPLLALGRRIPEDERSSVDMKLTTEIHACVEEATMAAWPEESIEALTALAPTSAGRDPVARAGSPAPRVVESLNHALHQLMDYDQSVYVIGEDILDPYGGAFKVTKGLSDRFPDRVWSTPISEAGFVGMASGMALAGMSPIVELMFGDFVALASDQIVNTLAKLHFLSRGQARTNVVIRTPMGGGRGYGATHSQSLEKMFLGTPGIKVVAVSTVLDPGTLLYNAVAHDPNPVLFVENKLLYPERVRQSADGWMDDFELKVTGGLYPTATLNVAGGDVPDVTIICYGRTALMAMEAAKAIFVDREIVAEIVVVSQLSPLSMEGLSGSAARSGRVLALEEGTLEAGWASEIIARLVEDGFRGQARRIGALPCPIPSSRPLEDIVVPTVEFIRTGLENLLSA